MNYGLTTKMYTDPLSGVESYIGHRNWGAMGFKICAVAKTAFQGIPVVFYKNDELRYVVSPMCKDLNEINFKSASDFSKWWKHHKEYYKEVVKTNVNLHYN